METTEALPSFEKNQGNVKYSGLSLKKLDA